MCQTTWYMAMSNIFLEILCIFPSVSPFVKHFWQILKMLNGNLYSPSVLVLLLTLPTFTWSYSGNYSLSAYILHYRYAGIYRDKPDNMLYNNYITSSHNAHIDAWQWSIALFVQRSAKDNSKHLNRRWQHCRSWSVRITARHLNRFPLG